MKKNKCYLLAQFTVLFVVFYGVLLLSVTTVLAEPGSVSYSFISIDVPSPDGVLGFTVLNDINEDGELLGGFTSSVVARHGFLLGDKFKLTEIQCPGASITFVRKINKFREITGDCLGKAFLRDRRGRYILIAFPNARSTVGTGINDHSQVVGTYRENNGTFHGFLWDDGKFFTIDVPILNVITVPENVNNRGQIVGFYFDAACSCREQGFLEHNGHFRSFNFPDAQATLPMDINNRGQIVGFYIDSNSVHHGFLLDGENFTTIDVPFQGIDFTEIQGISDDGEIVGRYVEHDSTGHGFVGTPKENRRKDGSHSQPDD